MKIDTNTWHYKLWRKSFSFDEWVPTETDLCRYCHKVFWQLASYAALVAMILAFIGITIAGVVLLGKAWWDHPLLATKIVAAIGGVILAIVLYGRWLNRGRSHREPSTLVGKYARPPSRRSALWSSSLDRKKSYEPREVQTVYCSATPSQPATRLGLLQLPSLQR